MTVVKRLEGLPVIGIGPSQHSLQIYNAYKHLNLFGLYVT